MKLEVIRLKDPLTGEEFIQARSTQKFACPANRIKFNNLKAKDFNKKLEPISKPIVDNFKIIEKLLDGKQELDFHIEFLLGKGYNFTVLTHMGKHENNYPCIHKYMIINMGNYIVKVRRHD